MVTKHNRLQKGDRNNFNRGIFKNLDTFRIYVKHLIKHLKLNF